MMKTFTSHWFSGIWTMAVMALSVLASVYTQDASHVARAGALVTLAGIFMQSFDPSKKGPTHTSESEVELIEQEEIEHLKAEKCGFWFLIGGTVIWAYGDLLLSYLTGW